MDDGDILEYRVAKYFFHQGYVTRQSLPLKSYFYPEIFDITDIDVYAIKFDNDFSEKVIIADCKSGSSPKSKDSKPLNRLFWLRGLMTFLGVNQGYFIKPRISEKIKKFAADLKIVPFDYEWLNETEARLNLTTDNRGSYAIQNSDRHRSFYQQIRAHPDRIEFYYWFLRIRFWTIPSNIQIKEVIRGHFILIRKCSFKKDYEIWLLGESAILLTIALLRFCSELYPLSEKERERWIELKMIEGIGSIEQQNKILNLMRNFAQEKVYETCKKRIQISEQELTITPPPYTPQLTELISRLLAQPEISIQTPKFLDFFIYEYIINDKEVNIAELQKLFPSNLELIAKQSKNIIKFLDSDIKSKEKFNKLMNF
jgi:hypothetical protein